jgi:hypothetical protein
MSKIPFFVTKVFMMVPGFLKSRGYAYQKHSPGIPGWMSDGQKQPAGQCYLPMNQFS